MRADPYFSDVKMTPIGDDPNVRDVLVEVTENRTASFNVGAGVARTWNDLAKAIFAALGRTARIELATNPACQVRTSE